MKYNKNFIFRNKYRINNDFLVGYCDYGFVYSGGKQIGFTGNTSKSGTVICVKTSNGYSFIESKTTSFSR